MNIKVIGSNCSNGIKLKKQISKIKDDYSIDVVCLDDDTSVKKYNVKNIPALLINDVKVSEGKVLTEREICKYLKVAYN